MADTRDTLLLPFEQGHIDWPADAARWLFIEAQPLPGNALPGLLCEQGHRGAALDLAQAGYESEPLREVDGMAGALVLATRNRLANERNLARAWNAVAPGGTVVFAGDTKSSVKALRKWAGARAEISGSLSKHHAVAFWMKRDGDDWPLAEAALPDHGFAVSPGMFSARDLDKGSVLLAEQFEGRLRGRVADFGAGWGYLASRALEVGGADGVELYEADQASLEAARANVPNAAGFHWCDITREAPRGPFDTIIMNPPFHNGRAAEPKLGQTFIEAAGRALPQGGRLLMVANTRLPYEAVIEKTFRRWSVLEQRDGFKVIEAVR